MVRVWCMTSTKQAASPVKGTDMESTKPFPATLKLLLEMQELTHRELTRRCQSRGWGSLGTINFLAHGKMRPTMKAMEAIAKALEEPPETFAEYRLGAMREKLDPEVVGLSAALKTLGYCVAGCAEDAPRRGR